MLSSLVIVTACFGGVFAGSISESNSYVDGILTSKLPDEIRNGALSPFNLPIFETEFRDKMGLINVKVRNNYKKGSMEGLGNVQRARDCGASYNAFGNTAINCTLEFRNLAMIYEVDIKYGRLPTVDAKIRSAVNRTSVFVEISTTPSSNSPTVSKFQVLEVGNFSNRFSGLGPLNRFLRKLQSGYNESANIVLQSALINEFRSALNRATLRTPMPL